MVNSLHRDDSIHLQEKKWLKEKWLPVSVWLKGSGIYICLRLSNTSHKHEILHSDPLYLSLPSSELPMSA